MSTEVDRYVKKTKLWHDEIVALRSILQSTALDETFKWSKPCYSFEGKNVAIIQPFKACLGLMFFKGVLLKDAKGVLIDNGPNSQAGRRFEFTSPAEINKMQGTIKAYVKEAIDLEKSGRKIEAKKEAEPIPDELKAAFRKDAKLKIAFEALTPGRQRAYLLHFGGAKQSATRTSRIEKCKGRILAGKGINDR